MTDNNSEIEKKYYVDSMSDKYLMKQIYIKQIFLILLVHHTDVRDVIIMIKFQNKFRVLKLLYKSVVLM